MSEIPRLKEGVNLPCCGRPGGRREAKLVCPVRKEVDCYVCHLQSDGHRPCCDQRKMSNSEKNDLAREVEERCLGFQAALTGNKQKYPNQEFRAFVRAARRYIDLTSRDPLVHRAVATAIN